jgi:hypothetical protein
MSDEIEDQDENPEEKGIDEEIKEIMDNSGLDEDDAEKVKEVMEETGLDQDDAAEIAEEL